MFTWICPKCGREVPPSMHDCPNCAATGQVAPPAQPVEPPAVQYAPPPAVQYVPPPPAVQYAPPPPPVQYAPPPQPPVYPPQPTAQGFAPQPTFQPPLYQHQPEPSGGLPSWLITVLVFTGLLAAGSLFYFYLLPSMKKDSGGSKTVGAVVEESGPVKANPLSKQVEVTGVRITEDAKQKLLVRLMVINHTGADLGQLKLNITLTSDSGKGPATVIGVFPVVVSDLGPYEAKEAKSSFPTTLRAYELPDWQFLRARAELAAE